MTRPSGRSRVIGPRDVLVGPVAGLRRPEVRLVLVSATVLFTELLLIRWIPANIRYVGFFPNFLLMSSFLGIGVGILLGRRFGDLPDRRPSPRCCSPWSLLVATAQLNVQLSAGSELVFGIALEPAGRRREPRGAPAGRRPGDPAHGRSRPAARPAPPLRCRRSGRTRFDIIGSLAGIARVHRPVGASGPTRRSWFAALAVGAARARPRLRADHVVGRQRGRDGRRPRRLHRIADARERATSGRPTTGSRNTSAPGPEALLVNGIPHQALWRFDDPPKEPVYEQVYRWFPDRTFDRVLIIGAGHRHRRRRGASPRCGSRRRGRDRPGHRRRSVPSDHPNRPYDDPRVTVHVDDGRNFLRDSARRTSTSSSSPSRIP